jgi:META domain-containing protein
MNDDHDLASAVRNAGSAPTEESRSSIRSALAAEVRGATSILVSTSADRARRRWWPAIVATVTAAAALVATIVVVNRGDDGSRIGPAATGPVVSAPVATSSVPDTNASPTTVPEPAVALDDLTGHRWVVVEQDGERWQPAHVPYLEFALPGLEGTSEATIGGNDGCNSYHGELVLEDNRLEVGEMATTAQLCPGMDGFVPSGGDEIVLSGDGTMLTLQGADRRPHLVFARLDEFAPANANALVGRWGLDAGALSAVEFAGDGTGTYGTCGWSWTMVDALTTSGWPDDPSVCVGDGADPDAGRLTSMLVGGPVAARLSGDGSEVYLSNDAFVIRLTKVADSSPGEGDPTAVDLLAGWPSPPELIPDIASVPLLLPTIPVPGATDAERTEHADDPATIHDYTQTWVGGASNTSVLVITTNLSQHHDPVAVDRLVEVGSWDTAFFYRTTPDVSTMGLDDPSGLVVVWGSNMSPDDIMDVAESLTARPDETPGWDVGALDASFTPLHEGWGFGAASRAVRWNAGSTVAELDIFWGVPSAFDLLDAEISATEVRGVPALAYFDGTRAAVTWSPAPDVVVRFGLYGSLDDAIAIARSIEVVDEATWEAASVVGTAFSDGCNSMFC